MLSLQTIVPDTLELLKALSVRPELRTMRLVGGTSLASPIDIAALKVNAIEGRGTKKDFVDIYVLLQHYSLGEILEFYKQKYPNYSIFRALRSLTYFEDAESQAMPKMFIPDTWEQMKKCITEKVNAYQ